MQLGASQISEYFGAVNFLSGLNTAIEGLKHVRLLSEELTALFPRQLIVE